MILLNRLQDNSFLACCLIKVSSLNEICSLWNSKRLLLFMNDFTSVFLRSNVKAGPSLIYDSRLHDYFYVSHRLIWRLIDALWVKVLQIINLRLLLTNLRLWICVLSSSPLTGHGLLSTKHESWFNYLPRLQLSSFRSFRPSASRKHWLIEDLLVSFRFPEYYHGLRLIISL